MKDFDLRKYLAEGKLLNEEEEEKEDIDSMDDLEDNDIYQEAWNNVASEAVREQGEALAKEYGFESYDEYYEKAYENPDDEINHEHYQEEFLPVARENAEIDYKVLDEELKEFLEYCNITFEVELRKKMIIDSMAGIEDYQ